jgi:hypothetical protein
MGFFSNYLYMNINNFTLYFGDMKYPEQVQNEIKEKIKANETKFTIIFKGKNHNITIKNNIDVRSVTGSNKFILKAVKNPPQIIMPWGLENESKLLFIALPISEKSQIGSEIYKQLGLESNQQQTSILSSPHITLFTAYIKKDSNLDILLHNSFNFNRLVRIIKNKFKELFNVDNKKAIHQLHSPHDSYKQLNHWVARMYDDDKYNQLSTTRSLQSKFIEAVKQLLLGDTITSEMKEPDYIPSDMKDVKPFTFLNSEMAISPYYIGADWEPHISLKKLYNTDDMTDTINKIKDNSSGQHMGWLNLWKVGIPKFNPTIQKSLDGSLENIFISYGKFSSYERL